MMGPAPSESHLPFPGATVGRWRILERVGSGNNGISSMLPSERAARPAPTRWHLARQALRRHSLPLAVAGALAACVLALVLLPPLPSIDIKEDPEHLAAVEAGAEKEEDAGVDERAVGLADGGVDGVLATAEAQPTYGVPGYVLAASIPKIPEPGQKKPPCNPADERPINGGCWSHVSKKPPCEGFYEHDSRCYAPVMLGIRREPTSEEP
jgi:hypothetical protein